MSVEPNIFAIIAASVLCLNLSTFFVRGKYRNQLSIISLVTLSIIFSYTRSVYVALAIAVIVMLILTNRIKLIISMFSYLFILFIIIASILIVLPEDNEIKSVLSNRITTLFDFQNGSGRGRVHGLIIAWDGFVKNPIFGRGTLSADTSFYNPFSKQWEEYMGSPGWLNGTLIQSLHDTGLIGFFHCAGNFCFYSNCQPQPFH